MKRYVSGFATMVAAAAVSVPLFAGAAQAGDPKNHDGPDGRSGSATATCRWLPPVDDGFIIQCTTSGGTGGAGGASVEY
ncbi:hypothetical protein [Pseudonocardia sp. DLS-67]